MRRALVAPLLAVGLVVGAGCRESLFVDVPSAPQNLAYEVEPSGDPRRPAGILLVWDDVQDPNLESYRIYSRGAASGSFGLRGETTSNTFHDNGVPHLQYYVTAVSTDGGESARSNVVTVNEYLQIESPADLWSISLNGAIHLSWTDNAYTSDPSNFKWYRVYSTSYDLDNRECGGTWFLEGTTLAPEFLSAALTNGEPRCFGVSAVSAKGFESLWSPLWQDTPRPDARNLLVYTDVANASRSGFRFWQDLNVDGAAQVNELGIVKDRTATDIDFSIVRDASDIVWIVPKFTGDSMRLYSNSPIEDLTSIDRAPASGYTRSMFQAVPTYGYVFQRNEAGKYLYAGLRVTHVGLDYVIFDFSVQTDPGNPELVVMRPGPVLTGSPVPGSR